MCCKEEEDDDDDDLLLCDHCARKIILWQVSRLYKRQLGKEIDGIQGYTAVLLFITSKTWFYIFSLFFNSKAAMLE